MDFTRKRFAFFGLLGGITLLLLAIKLKPSPPISPQAETAKLVEVMPLALTNVAPSVIGYGRVAPKHQWQSLAEVSGKVLFRHPQLETGQFLQQGTLVLTIDPLEYELKLAQAQANIQSSQAQLEKLTQEQTNLETSLEIEQQQLALVAQEYRRKKTLKQKGLVSNSEFESQKQTLLGTQKAVQDLQSALALLPGDRAVAKAQINLHQAQLEDAKRQLANTQIVLPFDARIAEVEVETSQAVSVGNLLFSAHQLGAVEIKAEVSLQDTHDLIASMSKVPTNNQLPDVTQFNFKAEVAMRAGNQDYVWPAKVTRIADTINPDQATVGFFLEVTQAYRQIDPHLKPPLSKGMFVIATIEGHASQQLEIPERALHGDKIYLMDKHDQLVIRPVKVLFRSSKGVVISTTHAPQERLILNDLIPAVPGMALKTVNNNEEGGE
ncbi:efflux RND transporter periplasmic adaptor subunit [Motilimonas pumila]|uniref:HlyD family secretion protein n=1 Tax=Motilimonas pumila TaxID=2303987 RepID=A0A418YFX7_9GAMM|nr:HlyD family secretion protein [Motilimonas pumila]RJG48154.1 HlyD family secretion protein [Motilimonas pumila]